MRCGRSLWQVVAVATVVLAAVGVSGVVGTAPVERFSGGGTWRLQEGTAKATRPWRVHMVPAEDGALRAKLSMPGVETLDGATVEAQVIGREAFGVLLDEKGAQIATFNATLWARGAGGSFVMGDGQSGVWEYDTTTKAEVLRLEALAGADGGPAEADPEQPVSESDSR